MSLNYDLRKIENRDKLSSSALNAMIFATMSLGINELSEKTLPEWWWRILFLHKIGWGIASQSTPDGLENWPKTKDDLRPFLGLSTNAGNETRAKFVNRMTKTLMRAVDYSASES